MTLLPPTPIAFYDNKKRIYNNTDEFF